MTCATTNYHLPPATFHGEGGRKGKDTTCSYVLESVLSAVSLQTKKPEHSPRIQLTTKHRHFQPHGDGSKETTGTPIYTSTKGSNMRILAVGDTHGNVQFWQHVFNAMSYLEYDVIVQVGDFGFWTHVPGGEEYLDFLEIVLTKKKVKLYWVDGNHENFDALYDLPVQSDGFRKIRPHIFHIPRGHTWTWDKVKFMGFGGAYSIDQMPRVIDEMEGAPKSWWPQEFITDDEVERAIAAGPVDVLFSHDVPEGNQGLQEAFVLQKGWPLNPIELSRQQRVQLRRVFDSVRPSQLIHGHYHLRYNGELDGCKIAGLAHDNLRRPQEALFLLDTGDVLRRH